MFKYELSKIKENVMIWIARKLPLSFKHWIVIERLAYHSVKTWPSENIQDITAIRMIDADLKATKK